MRVTVNCWSCDQSSTWDVKPTGNHTIYEQGCECREQNRTDSLNEYLSDELLKYPDDRNAVYAGDEWHAETFAVYCDLLDNYDPWEFYCEAREFSYDRMQTEGHITLTSHVNFIARAIEKEFRDDKPSVMTNTQNSCWQQFIEDGLDSVNWEWIAKRIVNHYDEVFSEKGVAV